MPRYRIVARRLSLAVYQAALAGVLLSPVSNVAAASGASGRPELPGWVVPAAFLTEPATRPPCWKPPTGRAEPSAASSSPMRCRCPCSGLVPANGRLRAPDQAVLRAVEQYQFSLKGKPVTAYVFFSDVKTCTWFAPWPARLLAARNRRRSRRAPVSTSSGYNSEVFSFPSASPMPTWWGQET